MVEILSQFARDNMDADKHEFAASWIEFVKDENVDKIIKKETELLEDSGYQGIVLTKMYKSVRYYFMKKVRIKYDASIMTQEYNPIDVTTIKNTEVDNDMSPRKRKLKLTEFEPEKVHKRAYYKISPDILRRMDNFIKSEIQEVENISHINNKEDREEDEDVEEAVTSEVAAEVAEVVSAAAPKKKVVRRKKKVVTADEEV